MRCDKEFELGPKSARSSTSKALLVYQQTTESFCWRKEGSQPHSKDFLCYELVPENQQRSQEELSSRLSIDEACHCVFWYFLLCPFDHLLVRSILQQSDTSSGKVGRLSQGNPAPLWVSWRLVLYTWLSSGMLSSRNASIRSHLRCMSSEWHRPSVRGHLSAKSSRSSAFC